MSESLRITPLGEQVRLIFHSGDPSPTLPGLQLPGKIGDTHQHNETTALCLGPQEWILFTTETEKTRLESITAIDTLVDVSHRFDGLLLNGADAVTALHMGCPLNLSDLAILGSVRTLFDTVDITVLRLSEYEYRVEFGRSYADYVTTRLQNAALEIAMDARLTRR